MLLYEQNLYWVVSRLVTLVNLMTAMGQPCQATQAPSQMSLGCCKGQMYVGHDNSVNTLFALHTQV